MSDFERGVTTALMVTFLGGALLLGAYQLGFGEAWDEASKIAGCEPGWTMAHRGPPVLCLWQGGGANE